ncbi:hypothetical protein KRR40_45700 [Niabella defluvii]|nr:hypothetical protein KRR40_45700 [Niabella sp. I65]
MYLSGWIVSGSAGSATRDQLLQVKGVIAVSFSSATPVEEGNNTWSTFKFDNAVKETGFKIITKFADTGYVPTYKLHLVAGRNLQPSNLTREFLVNELLVKKLGFKNPEDILGKEISIWGDVIKCPVVGVLQDFNNRSFRYEAAPSLLPPMLPCTALPALNCKLKT